jgi:pilus assembly protein Flp/PilA
LNTTTEAAATVGHRLTRAFGNDSRRLSRSQFSRSSFAAAHERRHDDAGAWKEIMTDRIKAFVANESGATAIEYALIASLIAIAIITALTNLGTRLSTTFREVSSNLK